jgi:hypothetical protein
MYVKYSQMWVISLWRDCGMTEVFCQFLDGLLIPRYNQSNIHPEMSNFLFYCFYVSNFE